jgi:integrase
MATIAKYEDSSGATLYEVRYRTPDRRTTRKRGFKTRRDAKAFAATLETSKLKGEFVSVSTGRVTIGELGVPWLERQRGHLKPSSFCNLEGCWRLQVLPRWANVRIADVRHTDVQAWVAELSATLGARRVAHASQILGRILDDAVRDRMLVANPTRGVKLPPPPPRQTYLTAAQLDMLGDEAGVRFRSLILLLGVGGLRWGEAAALRPCDIDFLRRRIEVHRNVVRVHDAFHLGTPKSGKSREVALPPGVIAALAQTAEGKGREDLMWTAPKAGGYLRVPGQRGDFWDAAVKRCQKTDPTFPRVTPHDLRHTAASLAISAGAHVKVVQQMLGHASAAMTLDTYAGLFQADIDKVAESVSKLRPRWA